ncbi:hypothetical protein G647_09052 [Cladophialophora carrionii CBS 160.54]|uniref:Protein kinase domain-containing protein n=1 Tax=Cladophialophora carrionii CBS 160.54 TaxID=1279043 RepID=V9D222_9EURO|nr:uncharacterized protein G647_09052 [Cladophialophora carrionii CBS 160.54]ETI20037.1 hypothetical protein G647_09052 [Cladophialophora carrionii CBS 160.54]
MSLLDATPLNGLDSSLSAVMNAVYGSESATNSPEESDNEEPAEKQLRGLLSEHMVMNPLDHKDFLPESSFKQLINRDRIRICMPGVKEDLIEFVSDHAPRLFAIVVYIQEFGKELSSAMTRFRKHGLTDGHLPIPNINEKGVCSYNRSSPGREQHSRLTAVTQCSHSRALDALHHKQWKHDKIRQLYSDQWMFLSPVFTKEKFEHNLDPRIVLPFTRRGGGSGKGHFSEVREVYLRADHQRIFPTEENKEIRIAIKEITNIAGSAHEAEKVWKREARALEMISYLNHPHLIRRIAAISRAEKYYFLFEWADGGTLRDFWESESRPELTADRVREIVEQLHGLAKAVEALHKYVGNQTSPARVSHIRDAKEDHNGALPSNAPAITLNDADSLVESEEDDDKPSRTGHFRHGDLKPDNILRFNRHGSWLGTLQVADLGLAKQHRRDTIQRRQATTQKYGTIQYEPPEVVTDRYGPRSRLYDMWAMGCIILETIIWLLYGLDALNKFLNTKISTQSENTLYYTIRGGRAEVSGLVTSLMKDILENDPECNASSGSALGDLIRLVADKLLLVDLPGPGVNSESTCRIDAEKLAEALANIKRRSRDMTYLFTGHNRANVQIPRVITAQDVPLPPTAHLSPRAAFQHRPYREPGVVQPISIKALSQDDWEFVDDSRFALQVFKNLGEAYASVFPGKASDLCSRCREHDFNSGISIREPLVALEASASSCDLCSMLLKAWKRCGDGGDTSATVEFQKVGSGLSVEHSSGRMPILSIRRGPSSGLSRVTLGFSQLPTIGSLEYFHVLRQWLDDCNKYHSHCRRDPHNPKGTPTRLIDVGTDPHAPTVRLHETGKRTTTNEAEDLTYIALSHPWGDPAVHSHFCTTSHNLDQHWQAIPITALPRTFSDAVIVTRALGVRFLWIDSLCIIQNDRGDLQNEIERMEMVFSNAYCVIAASRATGMSDGFLDDRPTREVVRIDSRRDEGSPVFVCEAIDDFQGHVIEGALNKRGWVLQERALARRTIYFTAQQTYWECGCGVRCETLTRMHNNQADFLGDPNFPRVAMESPKGAKIRLYESLYKRYSRLEFTALEDKPVAIAGLEQRLIRVFDTHGGFGLFEQYLGRSLLWQRDAQVRTMTRIHFRTQVVPSWSWMAYEGGITFMDLPFKGVDWERKEIRSPWNHQPASGPTWLSTGRGSCTHLEAVARSFWVQSCGDGDQLSEPLYQIVFDQDEPPPGEHALKCVIIGRSKLGADGDARRHYVLIVGQQSNRSRYERVGVGFMPGNWIVLDEPGLKVSVY